MVRDAATPPDPAEPPPSVLLAVRLMYVGAVLGLLAFGFELLQRQHTWEGLFALAASRGIPVNQTVGIYQTMLGVGVLLGPIGAVAWIFLASMNRRGYRWARMIGSGTLFVGVLGVLWMYDYYSAMHPFALLLWTATVGVGACVVLLTWHSSAKAYYARDQRAATASYSRPAAGSADATASRPVRGSAGPAEPVGLDEPVERPRKPADLSDSADPSAPSARSDRPDRSD